MYLLIPSAEFYTLPLLVYLHPTMYLLIPNCRADLPTFTSHYVSINSKSHNSRFCYNMIFTSHYVSINSCVFAVCLSQKLNLHPTMYLLILLTSSSPLKTSVFTSHYVSINSPHTLIIFLSTELFTSHYVSINSTTRCSLLSPFMYLHPTMYLLIRN